MDARKQPAIEAGARFSHVASSTVLNCALHDLDIAAAAETFIQTYDPTKS
jgi:hypothetical protein